MILLLPTGMWSLYCNNRPTPDCFGQFGDAYVPATLMPSIHGLECAYNEVAADPAFGAELDHLQPTYTGRPTPLTCAGRLTAEG